jgi:hypothetical protein
VAIAQAVATGATGLTGSVTSSPADRIVRTISSPVSSDVVSVAPLLRGCEVPCEQKA